MFSVSDFVGCDPKLPFPGQSVSDEESEVKKPGFRLWSEGPNFDTDLPQDVSGVVGQTAYLTCRVFDRENKTVSTTFMIYTICFIPLFINKYIWPFL